LPRSDHLWAGRRPDPRVALPGSYSRLTSLAVPGELRSGLAGFGVLRRSPRHDARATTRHHAPPAAPDLTFLRQHRAGRPKVIRSRLEAAPTSQAIAGMAASHEFAGRYIPL